MSLGWQCESALSKFKAKPINNVGGKSMIDLLAAVYDQQQKLNSSSPKQNLNISRKRKIPNSIAGIEREKDIFSKKVANEGGKSKIVKEKIESEVNVKDERVVAALRAKALLYDQIRLGQVQDKDLPFLVNFDTKPVANLDSGEKYYHTSVDAENTDNRSDIIVDATGIDISDQLRKGKEVWAWSTGTQLEPPQLMDKDSISHKKVREEISQRIEQEVLISQEARVRSQWEKTLKGDTKAFLEQIHRETEADRGMAGTQGSGGVVITEGRKTDKEVRKEMLQRLRREHGKS